MYTYLAINIAVIAGPIIVDAIFKTGYWKRWRAILASLLIGGGIYITWDVIATARGDWSFSSDHITGVRLAGLPLEEILFFVTVPYACLFIYHTMTAKFFAGKLSSDKTKILPGFWLISGILALLAIYFAENDYTRTILIVTAATLLVTTKLAGDTLNSKKFWAFQALSLVAFLAINSLLTGIPVVIYNPDAITNFRIGTIPVEDFLYNFAMLTTYLIVFLNFGDDQQPVPDGD